MKTMWAIFLVISAYICVRGIVDLSQDYYEYNTITSISIVNQIPALFPAITICNLNPFQTEFALKSLNDPLFLSFISDDDFSLRLVLLNQVSLFNDSVKKQFAFDIGDILIKCTFSTQPCFKDDFEWYFHPFYGTCWRFNSRVPPRNLTQTGYAFGLRLELLVGDETRMPSFLTSSGYQIMIDNQTHSPTILQGFYVTPGADTYFEISRSSISRLEEPYSDCSTDSTLEKNGNQMHQVLTNLNLTYSQSDCFLLVIQKSIIETCKCFSTLVNRLDSNYDQCKTPEQIRCVLRQAQVSFGQFPQYCPFECETHSFDTIISSSHYPIQSYAWKLLNNTKVSSMFSNGSPSVEKLKRRALAVNFYYKDFSYTYMSEQPKSLLMDFISNIGGLLGLYTGAVLEFSLFVLFILIIFFNSIFIQ